MRVVVTAEAKDLDARVCPVFGRAPVYVFVDTDTMDAEAVENPATMAPGGAGVQAAQFVVERGAEAVITGSVGPNAFNVLSAAGVAIYPSTEGTVRQAVEALRQGRLVATGGATGPHHGGMGGGRGRGMQGPATPTQASSREAEIADLKRTAAELRRQLAEVIDRLDRLEKE